MAALEFLGQAAHLGLSRQIGLHELDRRVAGLLPDLGRDRLALVRVPPDSYHRRALPRQAHRGCEADPRRRARHQADLSGHAAILRTHDASSRVPFP